MKIARARDGLTNYLEMNSPKVFLYHIRLREGDYLNEIVTTDIDLEVILIAAS